MDKAIVYDTVRVVAQSAVNASESLTLGWVNIFAMLAIAVTPGVIVFIIGHALLKKNVTDLIDHQSKQDKKLEAVEDSHVQLRLDIIEAYKSQTEEFATRITNSFSNTLQSITQSNNKVTETILSLVRSNEEIVHANDKVVETIIDLVRSNGEIVQSNVRAEDAVKRLHERFDNVQQMNNAFQDKMIENFVSVPSCNNRMRPVEKQSA